MAFTSIVPDAFPALYETDFRLQFQQLGSRLSPFVDTTPVNGKLKQYPKIAAMEAIPITTRFGETNPGDIDIELRSLFVSFFKLPKIVDRREAMQLGQIGGPQTAILTSQLAAAGRNRDSVFINGIIGNAFEGENGVTPVALPGGQTIPVNFSKSGATANTGMTFDKIIGLIERAGAANVTGQSVENSTGLTIALSHYELGDLLTQEKLTNNFYVDKKPLAGNGTLYSFLGVNLMPVDTSILPYNAGTDIRTCVAFARSSVMFGYAEMPMTRVEELPTHNYNIQLYAEWGWGATRLYDEGVWLMPCDRSPA
jgi:hypothetical protein